MLLWRLAGRLAVPGAWLLAAAFAVHPLHVESVVWIIERKDVLSGLFYLAAFLAWLRLRGGAERGGKHYALALGLFMLGMLCKSIVVTLPRGAAHRAVVDAWPGDRARPQRVWAPFFAAGAAMAAADLSF